MPMIANIIRSSSGRAQQSPGVPAWLSGLAVNHITEIAGTKLSDQPTHTGSAFPEDKQDAWCGWAGDPATSRLWSPGQGGHNGYHGNEVNQISLAVDVPAWSQLIAPSLEADVLNASDYYADGKPSSLHGYHTNLYIASLNKIVRFWGGARIGDGSTCQNLTSFDLATGQWDTSAYWSGFSAAPGSGLGDGQGAYAQHPTTGAVYCWVYVWGVYKWTPADRSITTILTNPANPAPDYTAGAVDPTRGTNGEGIAFFLGGGVGGGGNFARILDIGAGTLSTITLTGTDISALSGMSLHYSQVTDKYYAVVPDASAIKIYAITPTSGTTWDCSLLSYVGTGPVADTSSNTAFQPYSKPQYLSNIAGTGIGGIAYSPRWGTNIWFVRLH